MWNFCSESFELSIVAVVSSPMKLLQVTIPWKEGLHLLPATQLVRLAKASKSVIWLKVGDKVADARSVLAILLLCASAGMVVNLRIDGEDEEAVVASVVSVFEQGKGGNTRAGNFRV
jgi:phosphotransferase system HPr (HPr) family protein